MGRIFARILSVIGLAFMAFAAVAHAVDFNYPDVLNHFILCNVTLLGDLAEQVPKAWAPLTVDELKGRAMMLSLTNRDYEGQIAKPGDSVYITQWQPGEATRKQVGSGHESFTANKLGSARVQLKADQVFSHVIELDDLVPLQSQLENPESELRAKMEAAVARKMDAYIISLISPSTATPDHLLGGVGDFNATALLNCRKLASAAKWSKDERWIQLLDPQYMNDLLAATTLVSSDYAPETSPTLMGEFGLKRFGFEIYENNTDEFLAVDIGATATADVGLSFVPSFMHTVFGNVEWFVTDNKSGGKFTYYLGLRVIGGACRGHDHAKKCIVSRATA